MNYVIQFSADISKYLVILLIMLGFGRNLKTNWIRITLSCIAFSAILSLSIISQHLLGELGLVIPVIVYYLKYIVSYAIAFAQMSRKIVYVTVYVDALTAFTVAQITNISLCIFDIDRDLLLNLVATIVHVALCLVLWIINKKTELSKIRVIEHCIPTHIYILLLCAALCLCALTSFNNYQANDIAFKASVINIVISIFTVIISSIIISLFVNVISKQQLSHTTAMLRNQVEIQIHHYDKLEKLNNEMRSFRHDYTNHLHSLLSLIKMEEYDDAEAYIGKLLKRKQKTQTEFNTGNRLADAILTDKSDTLVKHIQIDYQGIIPTVIDNLDLCVILTNSLDNAIEACKCFSTPCTISISAQKQQGYFVLSMKNPTKDCGIYTNIPATTKSDSENHGLGLLNIQDIVKKYDGQMKIHCEHNVFELSLVLKL